MNGSTILQNIAKYIMNKLLALVVNIHLIASESVGDR